jgi:hypothetical protein
MRKYYYFTYSSDDRTPAFGTLTIEGQFFPAFSTIQSLVNSGVQKPLITNVIEISKEDYDKFLGK